MFSGTPSLQEVVDHAYALFAASVSSRLVTIGDGAEQLRFRDRKRKTPANDSAGRAQDLTEAQTIARNEAHPKHFILDFTVPHLRKAMRDAQPQPGPRNTVRTRGAVTGHNVRYVLAFSSAGIIIAFIVVAFYFGNLPF